MTRRPNRSPREDENLQALLAAGTRTVTIFGKSWLFQVEKILRTTPRENESMIRGSVEFLVSRDREVIYDAEHFFDGFRADHEYALSTLKAAEEGGASRLVLCDTRGGALPSEVLEVTRCVVREVGVPVGIHAHNDRGMATANSLFAVSGGATQVQGTMNGIGERVGNADLIEVVANLHLMGAKTRLPVSRLTSLSRFICEISGLREDPFKPFVGKHAFAHKGGVHGDAVLKAESAYEFLDPRTFGNARAITVSSQAGRASLLSAVHRMGFRLSKNDPRISALLRKVKCLEAAGCNLEIAEASMQLVLLRSLSRAPDPLRIIEWEVAAQSTSGKALARCSVRVDVNGRTVQANASGNGPVNALDHGLRDILVNAYKEDFQARLTGYRVKEIDSESATAATVAVYIDFADGSRSWTTAASSTNIIEASLSALVDGYVYGLRTQTPRKQTRDDRTIAAQGKRRSRRLLYAKSNRNAQEWSI
jgi:2-isopropylmalate synthase